MMTRQAAERGGTDNHVAMIGFGEAAEAFAIGWGSAAAPRIAAWDIVLDQPVSAERLRARAARCGVGLAASRAEVLAGADVVFCLVTAGRALAAARECAPHLSPGARWMDGNSCSPGTKRTSAAVIEAAGGRYVDVAIMAPVHPRLPRTPLSIAGPRAADAAAALQTLGMQPEIVGTSVGEDDPFGDDQGDGGAGSARHRAGPRQCLEHPQVTKAELHEASPP